jgi:hypothetical protein
MKLRKTIWALAFALLLCVTEGGVQAQNQGAPSAAPIAPLPPVNTSGAGGNGKPPAAAARGVSGPSDPVSYDPSQVTPDDNTLSGAQQFGLGSLDHAHDIFDPSISISGLGLTSPGTAGQTNLAGSAILNGSLAFDRIWSINHLTIVYNGGENFTLGPTLGNTNSSHSQFHNFTFSQQMTWARWHILIRDDFTASPGAAFMWTGMGGPGLISQFSSQLGSTLSSFGQAFTPGETIETGNVMRYRNSILGHAEYSLSRRSAVTFAASYGLLDFAGTGFVNSHMLNAQAGYDYLLDPTNSIAVLASYGKIDYSYLPIGASSNVNSSTTSYMAALAYGKKITGRVAFQAEVGPEQIRVSDGSGIGNYALWFVSANTALTYNRRRSGFNFSYNRGLSAGSGVFLGSTANTFSGSGNYQFTRFLTGSVDGGYALNNSLAPAGVATTSFNNWFLGANLGRRLGQHALINFSYGLQHQGAVACPVASCGGAGFRKHLA